MPWQLSLLALYIAIIGQSLWQRRYAQASQLPESWPPAIAALVVVTPLSVAAGLLTGALTIHWTSSAVLLLALEGVLIGGFNYVQFTALKRVSVARFETILQLYGLIVIVLGAVLLNEQLRPLQLVGAAVLIAAATLAASAPRQARNGAVTRQGIILTFASAALIGVGVVAEKATLHFMDYGAYFIVGIGAQTICVSIIALTEYSHENRRKITCQDIKDSATMGLISALYGLLYIYTIKRANNVALVTALLAFSLPLTVVASHYILHERDNKRLMWGATSLGFIGLLLTAV